MARGNHIRYFLALCLLTVNSLTIQCYSQISEKHIEKADSLMKLRQFAEAEAHLISLENLAKEESNKDRLFEYHLRHGTALRYLHRLDESEEQYLKARDIISIANIDIIKQGKLARNLGSLKFYQGNYDESTGHFENAVSLFTQINDLDEVGKAYIYLGILSDIQGNAPKALDYYLKALEIKEDQGNKKELAMILNNIGIVYDTQGDTTKAEEYHRKSLKVGLEIKDSTAIARSYTSLGNIIAKSRPDDALDFYQQSIALNKRLGRRSQLSIGYSNAGTIYSRKGDYDTAIHYFNMAYDINMEIQDNASNGYVFSYLGETYYYKKEFDKARKYLKDAIAIGKETQYPIIIKEASNFLYLIEKEDANYKSALSYLEDVKQISDSLKNNDITEQITKLELNHEFDKERQELKAEQEQRDLEYQRSLEKERWILAITVFVLLFIAAIALLVYKAYKLKRRANERLEEKNDLLIEQKKREKELLEETIYLKERELAGIAMVNHEKNSILSNIDERLNRLAKDAQEDQQQELKALSKAITSNINTKDTWDSFIHQFEKVHPDFFQRMKAKYPILTVNDLKMSAYIKVGMDNKEIAQATGVAVASVKKNINRLKKKLDLGADDSIRDFLIRTL